MFDHPQRVAWITVVSGFFVFCLICAAGLYGARWFVFDSTTSLHATAHVSRGTIGLSSPDEINERVVRSEFPVDQGDSLRTDELTQGHLSISDPLEDNQVVATIQVMPGSQLQLNQAARPRFGLSQKPYTVRLRAPAGTFEVYVSPQLTRELRLEMTSTGRTLRIDQPGLYLVTINTESIRLTVRRGEAVLVNTAGQAKLVMAQEAVVLTRDDTFQLTQQVNYDILTNALFNETAANENQIAANWGCRRDRDITDEPRGNWQRVFFQGRYAMHLLRRPSQPVSHSETGCQQVFPDGLDVSDYDSLSLRVSLYPVFHDLNGCGTDGTECVVMVRMRFYNERDIANNRQNQSEWVRGFYLSYDPNTGSQIRCRSCSREHVHVSSQAWFTYQSEDFVLDLPAEQSDLRPVEILSIEFYASGHKYETYVSEVALVGSDFD